VAQVGASAVIEGFHLVASGLFNIAIVVGFEKHDTGDTKASMTACMTQYLAPVLQTGAISEFANQALV